MPEDEAEMRVATSRRPEMTSAPYLIGDEQLADAHVRVAWPTTLVVVGLQRARPFLSLLGLTAADVALYEQPLQRFVRDVEGWMSRHPHPSEAEVIACLLGELNRLFAAAAAAAGPDAARSLRAALDLACAFDRPASWRQAWQPLIVDRLARRWSPNRLGIDYDIDGQRLDRLFAIVTDVADRTRRTRLELEKADAEPLLGWDAEAYELRRREDPDLSPITGLELLVEQLFFDGAWWQIVEALAPAELDELQRWGLNEAAAHVRSVPAAWVVLPPSAIKPPGVVRRARVGT
jgi:hypothetical protein